MEKTEINLKEILVKLKCWFSLLVTNWKKLLLIGLLGGGVGLFYSYRYETKYIAELTFALEDEKSSTGLSGAMGLASSLGIDLGSNAGSAFSGANLIELMKSRSIVEKALLNPVTVNGNVKSLANFYIKLIGLDENWNIKQQKEFNIDPLADRKKFTLQQDSIMGILYERLNDSKSGILSVAQKDKKLSLITVKVATTSELFSKSFTESLAKEVSEFYVESKSKKAKINVDILQKQTDSIRAELNFAINGVAIANDQTYNLNPALNINRTPSTKRQVDVQTNAAILTQLVTNLAMAKVTLLKETPLIQVIDRPILPLKKDQLSKIKSVIVGTVISFFLFSILLIIRKELELLMKK